MTKYRLEKMLKENWIAGYSYNGKYVNEKNNKLYSKVSNKR